MEEHNNTKLLSIGEAADYIGVSKDTLRRWERENKLMPFRTPGNQRRYSVMLLNEALMKKQYPKETVEEEKPSTKTKPTEAAEETIVQYEQIKSESYAPAKPQTAAEEPQKYEDLSTNLYLPHPFLEQLEQSISQSLNQAQEIMDDLEQNSSLQKKAPLETPAKEFFGKFYQPKNKKANSALISSIAASLVALGLIAIGMYTFTHLQSNRANTNPKQKIISPLPQY
ncbi:hypothetical protein COT52_01180 [candidate division WWE3 bacterium CG08_land_8_20_14_0_20_43_13]|uniref:HTH merR-type domain-containing protein n=1 Tax=candidate division WWE3 bacterium CG08_land_8_20_14_0_20_43_13 TaxID=1975087 RepID=A0A2H0X7N7_UNCKA|nr:MAG: hypothetical protein COT52_01180 [candidate division WWE3 bacterium CG08_land_8_20_14_0_20_43_13]